MYGDHVTNTTDMDFARFCIAAMHVKVQCTIIIFMLVSSTILLTLQDRNNNHDWLRQKGVIIHTDTIH